MARLRAHGLEPRRSLGQHFLLDPGLLRALVDAGDVGPGDCVLEVGTGPGTLTRELAARAGAVVTVEIDRRLLAVAREVVGARPNVTFIEGDALDAAPADPADPAGSARLNADAVAALDRERARGLVVKLVANLPYSIATPLVVRLLEADLEGRLPLAAIAATVQLEAARRFTAGAITKDYGVSSCLVQALASARIVRKVGRKAFHPPPEVESAMVRIVPRLPADRLVTKALYPRFRDLVRATFQQRRKTLRNALGVSLGIAPATADRALAAAGIAPEARVESLSPAALAGLAAALDSATY